MVSPPTLPINHPWNQPWKSRSKAGVRTYNALRYGDCWTMDPSVPVVSTNYAAIIADKSHSLWTEHTVCLPGGISAVTGMVKLLPIWMKNNAIWHFSSNQALKIEPHINGCYWNPSTNRSTRRNLWVVWCFLPCRLGSGPYTHFFYLGNWDKLFLRNIYIAIFGVANHGLFDYMTLLSILSCLVSNVCFNRIV